MIDAMLIFIVFAIPTVFLGAAFYVAVKFPAHLPIADEMKPIATDKSQGEQAALDYQRQVGVAQEVQRAWNEINCAREIIGLATNSSFPKHINDVPMFNPRGLDIKSRVD